MKNEQQLQDSTKRRRRIVSRNYRGYPLGNEEAYDARLIDGMIEVIDDSLEQHSRVLVKRIDIRLPDDMPPEESKKALSDVNAEIMRNFNRSRTRGVDKPRPSLDAEYMMTIERNESDRPHGHVSVLFNGNVVENGYHPMQEMKTIVERKLGNAALLHECRNGEFMLHRGNEEEKAEVVRATSYMAKVKTKENNRGREVMRSHLKRKKVSADKH